MYTKVFLKPHKEKPIQAKHHWIFSGAVRQIPKLDDGEIVEVYSDNSRLLGHGFFNSRSEILIRMINFDGSDPSESLQQNIAKAVRLRANIFNQNITNAYRLINSEGDLLSGLTVDRYADVLVVQISSLGIEKQKKLIVETLIEECKKNSIQINTVYERSKMTARAQEGLSEFEGLLWGKKVVLDIEIVENSIKFAVDIVRGQKTGLFLDMREMRSLIGTISSDKKVLNCFGYNGGFSLYSARDGAKKTVTVDISKPAIDSAKNNFQINFQSLGENEFIAEDVFKYLEDADLSEFDIVILDPPAFAKKKQDVSAAIKAYKRLNSIAMSKVKSGSIILTCSCSYHIDKDLFQEIVLESALQGGRGAKILSSHRQAQDHPLNIFHPENDYLKSLLISVD